MTGPEETSFAEPEPSSRVKVDGAGEGAGMEAPGLWWVMLLLVLRSSGAADSPAPNPPRHRVSGIRGGSVSLPVFISPTKRVVKIEWNFQPPSGLALVIAEFTKGKLERPNPSDRFGQRLEMADEVTLRIAGLELGDRGVYTAHVRLASAVVEEHSFSCSVYEPVPEPQIRHQVTSRTAEGCNVTLRCLASEKGAFNISWKRGGQLSILEEGSDWYQLSAEGLDLHVAWRPDSSDPTVTCLLSNPVDQKNVSLDLLRICQREGASDEDTSVSLLETWRLEPIPDPQISHQVTSRTAEGCNVTLRCLPSEQGPFNISWKRGDQLGVLEDGSDRYQLSAEGTELLVSWRPNSSDPTITCLLSSPVDQKNVSFDLLGICQREGARGCFSWVRGAMLVGLLVQIVTVASLNILERTGQKQK